MRSKLKSSERVEQIFYQHWITLVLPIFIFCICAIVFTSILILKFKEFSGEYNYLLSLIFIPGIFLAVKMIQRRFKKWIITNLRVITEWGIISVNIKESPLDKINSISYHKTLWGRILNYGDVVIQTAAERGDIMFDKVASPDIFANIVSEMRGEKIKIE